MNKRIYIVLLFCLVFFIPELTALEVPVLYKGLEKGDCTVRLFIEGSDDALYFGIFYSPGEKTDESAFRQIAVLENPGKGNTLGIDVLGTGKKSSFFAREISLNESGPASNILVVSQDSCGLLNEYNPIVFTNDREHSTNSDFLTIYHRELDWNCASEFKVTGMNYYETAYVFYLHELDTIPLLIAEFEYQNDSPDFIISNLSNTDRVFISKSSSPDETSELSNVAMVFLPDCNTDGENPYFSLNTANSAKNDSRPSGNSIYPNPASEFIILPETYLICDELEIIDFKGAIVCRILPSQKIDISLLSSGFYILSGSLKNGDKIFSSFVKL